MLNPLQWDPFFQAKARSNSEQTVNETSLDQQVKFSARLKTEVTQQQQSQGIDPNNVKPQLVLQLLTQEAVLWPQDPTFSLELKAIERIQEQNNKAVVLY